MTSALPTAAAEPRTEEEFAPAEPAALRLAQASTAVAFNRAGASARSRELASALFFRGFAYALSLCVGFWALVALCILAIV